MKLINKGFTLIELLIVIAILGTLAVVVLVAIDPVQQLAKTRDSGRFSGVGQLGRNIQAYSTNNAGELPTADAQWAQTLVDSGEITTLPSGINYSAGSISNCTTNVVNDTWCYNANANGQAIVFARLEANSNINKCPSGLVASAWIAYLTTAGRAGTLCTNGNEPAPSTSPSAFMD